MAIAKTMTPFEAKAAFAELRKRVGPKCSLSVFLNDPERDFAFHCSLYPAGFDERHGGYVRADADTFEDLLTKTEAAWAELEDTHRANTIAKMALAIIRLTDSVGECSEAMLRLEFDPGQVAALGPEACIKADEMASRGPFSIRRVAGANASEAI